MTEVYIRTPYGASEKVTLACGEGRTKQAFKSECDVNSVLARYAKTGVLGHVSRREPRFEDVSTVGDFREALEKARSVSEMMRGLPEAARKLLRANPMDWFQRVYSAEDRDELVQLGLLEELPEPAEEPPAAEPPAAAQ